MMRSCMILFLSTCLLTTAALAARDIDEFERDMKAIKARVAPSIVKVIAENHKRYVATGIALTPDTVLSSTLIVRIPYRRLLVRTVEGRTLAASVLGQDPGHSLVVLKVQGGDLKPVKPSRSTDVGDWVALLGVFYDKFPSIVQGIVSSISEDEMILNAPVFPGASGGAVVNRDGDLVAVIRGRVGVSLEPDISIINDRAEMVVRGRSVNHAEMCYAVPVEKVLDISSRLKQFGSIPRGWLGIYLVSESLQRAAVITRIVTGSPAEDGGLRVGDLIQAIDGEDIRRVTDVGRLIRNCSPGDTMRVKINREGRVMEKTLRVGDLSERDVRPSPPLAARIPSLPDMAEFITRFPRQRNIVFFWHGSEQIGIDVIDLTPELASKFGVREGYGLMVSRIYPGSAAEKADLEAGDILVEVSRRSVKSLRNLQEIMADIDGGSGVLEIAFYRKGKLRRSELVLEAAVSSRASRRFIQKNLNPIKEDLNGFIATRTRRLISSEMLRLRKQIERLEKRDGPLPEHRLRELRETLVWLITQARETFERELERSKKHQQNLTAELKRLEKGEKELRSRLDLLTKRLGTE